MGSTDLLFLFMFLPLACLLYHVLGQILPLKNVRPVILLGVSLFFYAAADPMQLFGMLGLTAGNVLLAALIRKVQSDSRKSLLCRFGTVLNVGLLIAGKFVLPTLPLGLSYVTFKAISMLTDIRRGNPGVKDCTVLQMAAYLLFFGQMEAGPLTRLEAFYAPKTLSGSEMVMEGITRIAAGFCKKVLLGNTLTKVVTEIFAMDPMQRSGALAWLGVICFSLALYYDFSGYSDMAAGISRIFGLGCAENFDYPYLSGSVSEFWRRWHISLGAWFRDYVYIPLGGSRRGRGRVMLNLMIVWLFTGIWHGDRWTFIVWGLMNFAVIVLEKERIIPLHPSSRIGKAALRIGFLVFTGFSWMVFRSQTLSGALLYARAMFFMIPSASANARAAFLLRDNLPLLMAGVLFCFPVIPFLREKCSRMGRWAAAAGLLGGAVLILGVAASISFIVAGMNNPFAYANF